MHTTRCLIQHVLENNSGLLEEHIDWADSTTSIKEKMKASIVQGSHLLNAHDANLQV
jgi:hypothetical protein